MFIVLKNSTFVALNVLSVFTKNKKWTFLIVLSIIWGSSFILMKKALIGLTPMQLGALRILISGVMILLVGFSTLRKISRTEWKWITLSGFLGTFIPAFLFALAITEIDSSIASILNSLTPLNTFLIGLAVFKIVSTRRQITGVIVGFIGTSLLIGAGVQLNPNQNYLFAGLILIASIMYGANVNIIKRYLQHVDALAIAAGNFIIVMVPALFVLIGTGFFKDEVLTQPILHSSLVYVFVLALFGTAISKVMFNKLVQISTPVFASSVTYLIPVVALFWGVLDGEGFSLMQGLAAVLIFVGVYLANRKN